MNPNDSSAASTPSKPLLFVGGGADGQIHDVPDGMNLAPMALGGKPDENGEARITLEMYGRVTLAGHEIMAPRGITDSDVIALLLHRYPRVEVPQMGTEAQPESK